jgi:hypothetical protein
MMVPGFRSRRAEKMRIAFEGHSAVIEVPDCPVFLRTLRAAATGWSYEALDTKLARETRAGTILQLGLYSALLQAIQGTAPEHSTSSCRATLVATWFSTRTAPMTPRRTSASSRG